MIEVLEQHAFFLDKHIETCVLLENQGYCNTNYLLVADGVKYIVRKLLRTDINRVLEWKILNLAYKDGITAEPMLYDSTQELMVFSFLEGKHYKQLTKKDIKNLVMTLKKLHAIRLLSEPISLEIQNQTDDVVKALKTIDSYPEEYVLCHNDLNPQNIFFSDKVKFIDWEYAGVNDRYFDLACVCVEFNLNDTMQKFFLDEYFKGDYKKDKLEAYKLLYVTLCVEWFTSLS